MRIVSWNVNGLRSALDKGLLDKMAEMDADMLCLQEIKAMPEQVPDVDWGGYELFWNPAEKKGYSGTLIMTRQQPLNVLNGMGDPKHDNEGRVISAEFKDFWLVTVYTPNVKNDLSRLPYRHKEWDPHFLSHVKKLEEQKPVVFCGDLNVAHREIDLARPKQNVGSAGFTDEERAGMDNIVNAGFIDSFRHLNDEGGHYSWWSFRAGARERNVGWRIDYVCISQSLGKSLKRAYILPEVYGSDHCPVGIELK
ncbi:MAG: exodeoxyribonuclease III [Planctomycetales bacterium]|nr:exodeoxyribonuclease III [bacterium]UNM08809.1 MAG: exodeoxyribonuclease III [Planctomycetales bacterium]